MWILNFSSHHQYHKSSYKPYQQKFPLIFNFCYRKAQHTLNKKLPAGVLTWILGYLFLEQLIYGQPLSHQTEDNTNLHILF